LRVAPIKIIGVLRDGGDSRSTLFLWGLRCALGSGQKFDHSFPPIAQRLPKTILWGMQK